MNEANTQIAGLKCTNISGMNSREQGEMSRQVWGGAGAWPGGPYGLCQGCASHHTLYVVEWHGQQDLHLDACRSCRYLTHNWKGVEKPYANKECLLRKRVSKLPPKASTLVNLRLCCLPHELRAVVTKMKDVTKPTS